MENNITITQFSSAGAIVGSPNYYYKNLEHEKGFLLIRKSHCII